MRAPTPQSPCAQSPPTGPANQPTRWKATFAWQFLSLEKAWEKPQRSCMRPTDAADSSLLWELTAAPRHLPPPLLPSLCPTRRAQVGGTGSGHARLRDAARLYLRYSRPIVALRPETGTVRLSWHCEKRAACAGRNCWLVGRPVARRTSDGDGWS
jgi:hypothetical protein